MRKGRSAPAAVILAVMLVLSACGAPETPDVIEASEAPAAAKAESRATPLPKPPEHSNKALFEYLSPEGTASDINGSYSDLGLECDVRIRANGGDVAINGDGQIALPIPDKAWKIGFSVYNTVDELGAMYLLGMKEAAGEAGIELLVSDAGYNQDTQTQAVAQWIDEGVDGVILTPFDFTGCGAALGLLEEAGVPVVAIDAPPLSGSVDSCVLPNGREQGRMAAEALVAALVSNGVELTGELFYGTLPFEYPITAAREAGFREVIEKYSGVKLTEIAGESPEDHYAALEEALEEEPDILGACGLYGSAAYGMMNALQAAQLDDIPLTAIDNDRVILEGIYEGRVAGSACYSAIDGARLGLSQMINLLEGVNIPGTVCQQSSLVTKDNVAAMFEQYYPGSSLGDYIF